MAMACGSRLASSLLQESLLSVASGSADARRASSSSSSLLRQGAGVWRKTCRVPAFSVVCCIVSFDSYVDSGVVTM